MTTAQILGLRRLLGLGALALLPGVIVYLSTGSVTATGRLEVFLGITVGLFFSVVVPVVTLVLSASALGDERRDQTLSFVVLRPISRRGIAAAKIGAAVAASGFVVGLGAIALGVAMGLRHEEWGYTVPLIAGAVIAAATYAALFTPLGYVTERATLAGLAFAFLWEGAVAGTIGALATLSPWRVGYSAFVDLAPPEILTLDFAFALGNVQPGALGALAKAAAMFAIGTAITTWILRTRDLA
jgi:ABC-2 type transport system permease protein